ncbi:hypothetical protein GpartN1_g4900.t1 [Galdieria partita]|uniref:Glutamine amidotransferase domain-containing protein n=1 Tax=Galdieria partita TaxID=83374 RepID=A0A9C7PYX1_9RHOD|nr:hypothetical protein GpartN1_g4900.t1 [Galdieria partita]
MVGFRVAVIDCQPLPEVVQEITKETNFTGCFQALFDKLVEERGGPRLEMVSFNAQQGCLPGLHDSFHAFLVTGSFSAAYQEVPWIAKLRQFLLHSYEASPIPLVGICFGHQILAQALGGLSNSCKNGPEVGLSTFTLSSKARNLPLFAQQFKQLQKVNLIAIHSDEVIELPAGAISLGGNDHCLYQGMILPCRVLSFQGHPEFSAKPEVYEAILTHVAKFPDEIKSRGLESLRSSSTDHIWVASCIRDFILQKTVIPE